MDPIRYHGGISPQNPGEGYATGERFSMVPILAVTGMAEVMHLLRCMKPFKNRGKNESINWCRLSVINSKSIRYCDKQKT